MPRLSLREALDRRFPQIVGLYLVSAWALLQFVDWVVRRYLLSSDLTDFVFALLVLVLPSVALVAWRHGRPGPDAWGLPEKIGIPANLAAAGLVLVMLFSGKELGAVTTTVTVEDEAGDIVERDVPKSAFRQKIALFYFDNPTSDTALDWLRFGVPIGMGYDLRQDVFVDARFGRAVTPALKEAGFASGVGAPVPLLRRIAEDQHMEHLVTGSVVGSDPPTIDLELYGVRDGSPVLERRITGDDWFSVVDGATRALKEGLGVPAKGPDGVRDLPVRELITSSEAAFRHHVDGYRALDVDGDWPAARRHQVAAVEADGTFAYAEALLYQAELYLGRSDEARSALRSVMDHTYRLAERDQFAVKAEYYHVHKQDIEKAHAVAETWSELYPADVEGHLRRAMLFSLTGPVDREIAAYERALEVDPSRHQLLRVLAGIHETQGEFDRALERLRQYTARFPDREEAFLEIGDVHLAAGRHDAAREAYERALTLAPEHVSALVKLAELEAGLGSLEASEVRYRDALAAADAPRELAEVYGSQADMYEAFGRFAEAVELREAESRAVAEYEPPLLAMITRLRSLGDYVRIGRPGAARDSLEAIRSRLSPPWDGLVALGELEVGLARRDPDAVRAAASDLETLIAALGFENLRPTLVRAEGEALEMSGDCRGATERYRAYRKLRPTSLTARLQLARCLRALDEPREAAALLEEVLRLRPAHPEALHELARLRAGQGSAEEARELWSRALELWSEADPEFREAEEARAALAEL